MAPAPGQAAARPRLRIFRPDGEKPPPNVGALPVPVRVLRFVARERRRAG